MSCEAALWSLDGGCGVFLSRWRVKKKARSVFEGIRVFDMKVFVFIHEGHQCSMLNKQDVGDFIIIEGMPTIRKRYRGDKTNIYITQAIPSEPLFLPE